METLALSMTVISPDEYTLLIGLSGNEQTIQATNIGKKYAMTGQQILAMLPNSASNSIQGQQNTNIATTGSSGFRFEYDPSPDASQRRQNIRQAVNCPSCGASLGIPSTRPIKVKCPQCLQETTYTD